MFYSNLSKTVALSVGVLAMVFLISYFVFAWQEPTAPPPGDQVPAPLNVGDISQIKIGHLTVNSFISGTSVGIGMTPIYPLDVSGDVRWSGTLEGGTVPWARLSGYPSITAGSGLTGGGTLSASRTLNVGAGTGITVGAAAVNLTHPSLSCPAGEAIRVFDLGAGTRTCIPVGNGNGITCPDCDDRFVNRTGDTMTGNLWFTGGTRYIGTSDSNAFVIRTNNTNRVWITSGGNVGIGRTDPAEKLHVAGRIRVDTGPEHGSDVATKDYVDAQAGLGTLTCTTTTGTSSCTCPTGYERTGCTERSYCHANYSCYTGVEPTNNGCTNRSSHLYATTWCICCRIQ